MTVSGAAGGGDTQYQTMRCAAKYMQRFAIKYTCSMHLKDVSALL